MTGDEWKAETLAIVATMWREGHSGKVIGEAVGRTRSAVMGKLHRMGLTRSRDPEDVRSDKQAASIELWRDPGYSRAVTAKIGAARRWGARKRREARLRAIIAKVGHAGHR